jgi:hypothetical protein
MPRLRYGIALLLIVFVSRMSAQELSFLGGGMSTRDLQLSTYTYQLDYRQDFTRYLSGSVAYINEGHIVGHHRDGTAFEGWVRLPLLHDRLALAAGIGEYYWYDTQPTGAGDTLDVHGTATLFSLSANFYVAPRIYLVGMVHRINAHGDVNTNTTSLGVGYWFGQDRRPKKGELGDSPEQYKFITPNQVTLFGGQSIVNSFLSEHALAGAIEYRRGILPHIDGSASWIYEGDPKIVRRSGVAFQVWGVNTFFNDRITVGAGLGPYIYIDKKHSRPRTFRSPAVAAPLVSLTVATKLSEQWIARLTFNRVTSNYNRDADVILVGLGYCWAR